MNKCMALTTRTASTQFYSHYGEKAFIHDNQIDYSGHYTYIATV